LAGTKIPEYNILHETESLVYQENGGVMIVEYRTVVGLKSQLSKFSGIISKRFKKPKRKR